MPKARKNVAQNISALWSRLREGDFAALDESVLSDDEQARLAGKIKSEAAFGEVFHLIDALPAHGKTYDWNVGGMLQHFDADLVISAVQHVGSSTALHESVGLSWAFGQFRNRHQSVVDHLYATVRQARDAEAWWQAAFSLEKLGVDDAVNLLKRSLKQESVPTIERCLKSLEDKRSLVALLLQCGEDTPALLYPKVKKAFMGSRSRQLTVNCCWLIGRLKLVDGDIVAKLQALTGESDYELRYYAFFALQNNATEDLRPFFEKALRAADTLSRKLASRGLRALGSEQAVAAFEASLDAETDPSVLFELSKTLYRLKNPANRERLRIKQRTARFENGMITASEPDPAKLNVFAESQDPENLAFGIVRRHLGSKKISNPVALNVGTGRSLRQMFEMLAYEGELYGLDESAAMCAFADASLRRERHLTKRAKVVRGSAADFAKRESVRSSLVVATGDFLGADTKSALRQLRAVHDLLADDGRFYSIGWDELFNDAFTAMRFKYVPDGIQAKDFEEWRERRMASTVTRGGCGLTWLKRGLSAPLQFRSLEESARIIGYLFGRDAAQYVVRNGRTEWMMSLGITCDTKKSLKKAILALESSL